VGGGSTDEGSAAAVGAVWTKKRTCTPLAMADLLMDWMNQELGLSQPIYSLEVVRRNLHKHGWRLTVVTENAH
jgi:hypothetical protein